MPRGKWVYPDTRRWDPDRNSPNSLRRCPHGAATVCSASRSTCRVVDYRMKGDGFDDGYQSVPVNWGISSERKRQFFSLLKEMTGGS